MDTATMTPEQLVRMGMLAALRDVQDYVDSEFVTRMLNGRPILEADTLRAFLLAQLIVAGAYENDARGES